MTARRAGLAFLMLGALVVEPTGGRAVAAEASPPRALVLRIPTTECATSPSFTAFVEALQVELAGSGPRCCAVELRGGPPQPGAIALDIEPCDPAAASEIQVTVDEGRPEPTSPASAGSEEGARARRVSLADVAPDARPRALALAVAELVRGGPPGPPAPPPAPVTAPPVVATAAPWGQSVTLEAVLRAQPTLDTLLGGGRLTFSLTRNRWGVALDADATAGSRSVDVGAVDVRLVHAAASVGPRFAVGRAVIVPAATAGLGWAWVAGRASAPGVSAGSGSGLVATAGVRVALEAPTSRSLRAHVSIEAGETLRRLTADVNGTATTGVSGPYGIVGVGVSVAMGAL
jgi:hypothetical protein